MQPLFITPELVQQISTSYQTPCYVYNQDLIQKSLNHLKTFPHAYGLTVRYAMKANPNVNILRMCKNAGVLIDASSGYEVERAIDAGIDKCDIQLSGQELPYDGSLLGSGIQFVATSLHKLDTYGKLFPNTQVGVRINPGVGSGAFKKIDTGGPTSSFGIRHEQTQEILSVACRHGLTIHKIHIHIGSENTSEAWSSAATDALEILKQFPDVKTLNLGGGFKVAIMLYEKSADIHAIGVAVKEKVEKFYDQSGRKIHLEIEPGKFVIMNTCSILAKVIDIVTTDEYTFLKLNTGMTELPRISMYGIQQPMHIHNSSEELSEYVVVGHCCESGDLLTCILYQSDAIDPISLPTAQIGDHVVIQSCGAYNSSMSMKNYNSFPEAAELLLKKDGTVGVMRNRQSTQDIWKHENVCI